MMMMMMMTSSHWFALWPLPVGLLFHVFGIYNQIKSLFVPALPEPATFRQTCLSDERPVMTGLQFGTKAHRRNPAVLQQDGVCLKQRSLQFKATGWRMSVHMRSDILWSLSRPKGKLTKTIWPQHDLSYSPVKTGSKPQLPEKSVLRVYIKRLIKMFSCLNPTPVHFKSLVHLRRCEC